jgi:hypothetical protein
LVSDEARRLHARTPIANLHADFAMLRRDATRRSDEGVSDFPRMREAGISLVGASICPGGFEMRLFFWWQDWPRATRKSRLARAVAMLEHVEQMQSGLVSI